MKVLAFALAGGEGTRLYPLTAEHAKAAVPFVNGFRLVDFVLSNLVNSNISTIYLLAQYKPESLIEHIDAAWAPWSTSAGASIKVVLPHSSTICGQFKGTADYMPGVRHYEESAYWRDVGTLEALAAAQNDVSGFQPRFNLWNHQWPIRGEGFSALLTKLRDWKAQPERADLPADLIAASQVKTVSPQRGRVDRH